MSEKREKPYWEGKHYSFFRNTECEYFPCHRVADPERFNCLFCYCPLYMLGPRCGGNFTYNEKGIKVCTDCVIPHLPENYGRITGKYQEIAAAMRQTPPASAPDQAPGDFAASAQDQAPGDFVASAPDQAAGDSVASAPDRKIKNDERQGQAIRKTTKPFGKIVMMACTRRGFETMRRAAEALADLLPESEILQTGRCADMPGYEDGPGLSQVTAEWFGRADALIYFAAAGIAVRCIAPFARDKFRDPAVLVSDENGKFVISLMSGHAGGANRLSLVLAEAIGARPVITTATDGRGLFAVDVFAAENGLQISDRTAAKKISARILAGETPRIYFEKEYCPADDGCGRKDLFSNSSVRGIPSAGVRETPQSEDEMDRYGQGIQRTADRGEADIIVSWRRSPQDREGALYLIPRAVTLGIGCRRGISEEAVRKAVRQILEDAGVFRQAVSGIASIDLKKEEQGLLAFAGNLGLPLIFYKAEELNAVPGTFTGSDFVRNVTGVDCVCERSAVLLASDLAAAGDKSAVRPAPDFAAAGDKSAVRPAPDFAAAGDRNISHDGGRAVLLVKKQSLEGVTTALALQLS